MAKRKEKLLDKFVKKDYNNDLEEILAKKNYSEEVKNLLQDGLYKTENAYKDYETVKKNTISIEEYTQNIINSVKKCDEIELIKPRIGQKETYSIDKENKKIVCFPNPKLLLYALTKLQKYEDIIKIEPDFLNYALTNTLNIGNCINNIEPIRDFNGFSWNSSSTDIENYYYNLIYQDLIILSNNKLIDEWVNKNDDMIDYMDLFKEDLEKKFSQKYQNEILELIKTIAVLMEMNRNKEYKQKILKQKEENKKELEKMNNRIKYLENISNIKKKLEKNIKKIDLTLNDKEKLYKEYEKRNKDLPLEQKIFSKNVLKKILAKEREECLEELKKCNDKMNAKIFNKLKEQYEYELKYLELIEIKDKDNEILERIIFLQKRVLQAIKYKIKKATSRDEINSIIYQIRYFNMIPINEKTRIGDVNKLKKMMTSTQCEAVQKAYELKDFKNIFKDKSKNISILKYLFSLKIIKLEDVEFSIMNGKEGMYVQYYDDDVIDEKFKLDDLINPHDLKIKFNKKIRVFDL